MSKSIIPDNDGKGLTLAFSADDVEYANPIEYYANGFKGKNKAVTKQLLTMKNRFLTSLLSDDFFEKKAQESWKELFTKLTETEVPKAFIDLFKADSKKEQIRILKGQSLTPDQLTNFLFKAYEEHGYLFSSYRAERHHKGVDETTLPKLISLKNDEVSTVGETSLTEGQLKNVILHRRVVVAKILDKGDDWHCFFLTYKSLRGEESWKDGQPHLHYISSKWGIPRARVVEQLLGESYQDTPVHIELLKY